MQRSESGNSVSTADRNTEQLPSGVRPAAERPILFSGPMVRAILAGTKSQTRRVIDFTRSASPHMSRGCFGADGYDTVEDKAMRRVPWTSERIAQLLRCPYGAPGDRLWVREAWGKDFCLEPKYAMTYRDGKWEGPLSPDGKFRAYYRADVAESESGYWKPSIHMPRWASRLALEITAVRVERLRDISDADAFAEGCRTRFCATCDETGVVAGEGCADCGGRGHLPCTRGFRELWDSINAKRGFGWEADPWVWAITFKPIHTPTGS